jgi:hypothetical protein
MGAVMSRAELLFLLAFAAVITALAGWDGDPLTRHTDPTAEAFDNVESAIEWAKAMARINDRQGVLDETLTDPIRGDGWLYCGCYSVEDDYLYVVKREVRQTAIERDGS